jgi:hypothetical protein
VGTLAITPVDGRPCGIGERAGISMREPMRFASRWASAPLPSLRYGPRKARNAAIAARGQGVGFSCFGGVAHSSAKMRKAAC